MFVASVEIVPRIKTSKKTNEFQKNICSQHTVQQKSEFF